jgi:cytochrome b561
LKEIRMRSFSPAATRYDQTTIWLHWATAALVLVQWLIAQIIDLFPKGMARIEVRSAHISLGLCLALLLIARLIWRGTRGRVLPPADRGVLQILATGAHLALYVLIGATIFVGFILVWVRGDSFFGLFAIPAFAPGDKTLADKVGDLHGALATLILVLAGLHALASLVHHFLRRDGVLLRMWPSRN